MHSHKNLCSRHGEKITLLLCTKTYGGFKVFQVKLNSKLHTLIIVRPCGHISSMAGDCGVLAGTTETLPSNHAKGQSISE